MAHLDPLEERIHYYIQKNYVVDLMLNSLDISELSLNQTLQDMYKTWELHKLNSLSN
jgi:hypothetical protein